MKPCDMHDVNQMFNWGFLKHDNPRELRGEVKRLRWRTTHKQINYLTKGSLSDNKICDKSEVEEAFN